MNALVALPLSTAFAVASPAGLPAEDHDLVALAEQIKEQHAKLRVALAELGRCTDVCDAMSPTKSRILLWNAGDDVGYCRYSDYLVENGKRFIWCDLGEVEKLREKKSFAEWFFVGTDEEWKQLGLESWHDKRMKPVKGHEHLFKSFGDERREKRAKELVAALDEYRAGCADAELRSGKIAADDAADEIFLEMDNLFDRMLALKPTSIEGYRAMAVAVFLHCWSGSTDEGTNQEERMIGTIVFNLVGALTAATA